MPRSFPLRVWDAVKPPPPLPARHRLNPAQRRLIRVTAIAMALGVSSWAVYAWVASAPDRALQRFSEGEFTRAIEIDPNFAAAYVARGDAFQAAGQSEAALPDFDKAIAIDPAMWQAYLSRGILRSSRGDNQGALTDFTRSLHLHPSAKAYYHRGLSYQTLGQMEQAVDDYDLAIDRDPGAPSIYRARAKAKRDLQDMTGAEKDRETADRLEKTQ